MQIVSDEKRFIVKEYLTKYRDYPTNTVANAIYNKYPQMFSNSEAARTMVRRYRGNQGNEHRRKLKDRRFMRENGESGFVNKLPESDCDKWKLHEINTERNLALSDIHIPYHDVRAIEASLSYADKYKPDTILLNGDIADCYILSKFSKDPRRKFKDEIDKTKQFLRHLRERFPNTDIVWKHGNHEERYELFLWNKAPELLDIDNFSWESLFDCDELGITVIKNQRIVMVGKLPVLHGHEFYRGLTNPVNPARGVFLRGIHTCLVSHWHKASRNQESDLFDKKIVTWSTGCLCGLHPEYCRINRWGHAFTTIDLRDKQGTFRINNLEIDKGKIFE